MLSKILLVALFTYSMVLAVDYQQREELIQPAARFLAFQTTKTTVTVVTTTVEKTVPSTCAVLAAGVTACRRRRSAVEKPVILSLDQDETIDLFNPSPVQPLETTQAVSLDAPVSGFEGLESSSGGSPVEVDIVGLQNECVGRRFGLVSVLASNVASAFPGVNSVSDLASSLASNLSLTLRFKTTLTATVTVTKTVTSGSKAFTVSNCTPSPFLYATCKP
ncbi:hypothetical protein DAPPUDRAFT_322265 [Daphnia pulex]|uniref:Uncharacterized protein n=1 Tax=Daphnia pulex TaxID=6669 RepID=E9GVE5_DAPPU|nr:hypothetical protein DAPPUDRAFT_322265 [Daphnia pulex]|eukprot:EFX76401.1 hypothetical protein DAPPUDRAFT_322265 [Daphnia pulex]